MTTLVVPYIEIEKLIRLILECFQKQTRLVILRNDIEYEFVAPREDMDICIALKSTDVSGHECYIKTYIDFYEFKSRIIVYPFRQEEVQNTRGLPGDQVYVSIALLPRSEYPTLSKMKYVPPNSSNLVGFNPQSYSLFSGNTVTLYVELEIPAEGTITVPYQTLNGTAIAGVDFTASSGELVWNIGDPQIKDIDIPILGDQRYFNWNSDTDIDSTDTFHLNLNLTNNNCRIRSPSVEPIGLPYSSQKINLASQYLPNETLYYEVDVQAGGDRLVIELQSDYYANISRNGTNLNWDNAGAAVSFIVNSFNTDGNSNFQLSAFNRDIIYYNSYLKDIEDPTTLPARIHFILDPIQGAKIGCNGQWYDFVNDIYVTDPSTIGYYDLTYYNENLESRDLETIAPRVYNFYIFSRKRLDEYQGVYHTLTDLSFIVNPSSQLYRPSGITPYTGIHCQTHTSQFTCHLHDAIGATIQNNPATIMLSNLSSYSFNKIVTEQDQSNLELQVNVNTSYYDEFTNQFTPMIQISKSLPSCGVFFDLTGQHHNVSTPFGSQLYPDQLDSLPYSEQIYAKSTVSNLFFDQLDVPLDHDVGLSIVVSFKHLLILYGDPFTSISGITTGDDPELHFGSPTSFYNGRYQNNLDGTYTYKTLLRYYRTSYDELVLVPVPPNRIDDIDDLPPLFLYFETESGRYTNNFPSNKVVLIVPYIVQSNEYYLEATRHQPFTLYYTTNGTTPTESSPSILSSSVGEAGQMNGYVWFNINIDDVDTLVTIKAFVKRDGWLNSPIIEGEYGFYNIATTSGEYSVDLDMTSPAYVRFHYSGSNQQYQRCMMNVVPYAPVDEIQYRLYTKMYTSGLTGAMTEWRVMPTDLQLSDTILPSRDLIKKFGPDLDFGLLFKLRQNGYSDVYLTGPTFSYSFFRFSFIADETYFSYDQEGEVSISSGDYRNVAEVDELSYGMVDTTEVLVLYDDFRYMEIEILSIVGSTTGLYIMIGEFRLNQDGTLVYPDSNQTSTSLEWGQGDTVGIRFDLRTSGFLLNVNNGTWYDESDNPQANVYSNEIHVYFKNTGDFDATGTSIRFKTRTSQFQYPIPLNSDAMDNYHD